MFFNEKLDAPIDRAEKRKTVSTLIQFRSKRNWNLERLNTAILRSGITTPIFDFVTVGTSGTKPEELIHAMRLTVISCNLLVDVRYNPFSRHTPAWNREKLKTVCENEKIQYVHKPDFGVPPNIRKELHSEKMTYEQFFSWYDENILTETHLDELMSLIKDKGAAFLCTELGPTYCHRHRIALSLEKKFELIGIDL